MMKPIAFIFLFLSGIFSVAKAQHFTNQTTITGITKDSLYKIPLTPQQTQYMSADLHDMRVFNSSLNEVPYVVLSEPLLKAKSDFTEYEIVSQKHYNSYTEVVVHNPEKQKISNIAFNINNSDAFKYCAVEGSDDGKQWYSVSALQELALLYNEVYTNQYKCIYFPLNDYKYFRLLVDDWYSQPLKINSAGYFKNSVIAGKLNPVSFSKPLIVHDTKEKKTSITLDFANNQRIDRIDFKIKDPRLYKRSATIYAYRKRKKKNKTVDEKEMLYYFELASDGVLFFDVPALNERQLVIEIDNKDNPPLEIDSILCKQLATYLICDFKANENYTLKCGNTALKLPEYDLVNFVTQIPQLLPEAKLGDMQAIAQPVVAETKKELSFFETKTFLWLCLGGGALIILLFSMSLLKDMGKKKD